MMGAAALLCVVSSLEAVAGSYVMTDNRIRGAVNYWLESPSKAEAAYGHISSWDTSGVTDMSYLFCVRQSWMDCTYFGQCPEYSRSVDCDLSTSSFNEDIGAWDTSGVTNMERMFAYASAFNQDLGWCVDEDLRRVSGAFEDTPCESTYCGVKWEANTGDCDVPPTGNVMVDWKITLAVAAWLSDATAAEATYGHISTWETGGVTDMYRLFNAYDNSAAASFNEDIGTWDTSGVTRMDHMFDGASSFNQDISGWAAHSVRNMYYMLYDASAFDQDLGWCVDDDVYMWGAFDNTPCASTSCGVTQAAGGCAPTPRPTKFNSLMTDTTIRTAVAAWASDATAAEATYGHISTWETGAVTDMSWLFLYKTSFNEPIGGWDVRKVTSMSNMFADARSFNQDISGWQVGKVVKMKRMFIRASSFNKNIGDWSIEAVTSMNDMFRWASAFDQDLGWCVGKDTDLDLAFEKTKCETTSCGVAQKDVIGLCEWLPVARPCLIGPDEDHHTECFVNSPTIIIAIVLMFLAVFGACVHRRKKKDETYAAAARRVLCGCLRCCLRCCCFCCRKKTEPSSVDSRPDSPAESPSEDSDEDATAPEPMETRAAASAKAKAAETAERPGLARKLSSFLFGEQEEEPTVAEAEEAPSAEQPPPLPPRRTEPDPAAQKNEEMYNQIAAWYNEPENAALRARWGAYPDPDEFQTWPGFVAVTNAFLDREAG